MTGWTSSMTSGSILATDRALRCPICGGSAYRRGYAPRPDEVATVSVDERRARVEQAAYFRAERRGFASGHEFGCSQRTVLAIVAAQLPVPPAAWDYAVRDNTRREHRQQLLAQRRQFDRTGPGERESSPRANFIIKLNQLQAPERRDFTSNALSFGHSHVATPPRDRDATTAPRLRRFDTEWLPVFRLIRLI